jgi:hypothetical protein
MPLGLMIQPAAQIVRELPPRPKSYCVTLFFHAGRSLPLGNVWSTVVVEKENEKGHLQLRPVGALPDISPTKASGKAERMCKWPQLLPPTATIKL